MVKIRRSFLIDWFQKSWASHFPSLGPNFYTLKSNIIMQITSPKFHLALVLEQTLLLWYTLKLRSKRTNGYQTHCFPLFTTVSFTTTERNGWIRENCYHTGKYPTEHCGNNAYLNSMGRSSLSVWREMFDSALLLFVSSICVSESRASWHLCSCGWSCPKTRYIVVAPSSLVPLVPVVLAFNTTLHPKWL